MKKQRPVIFLSMIVLIFIGIGIMSLMYFNLTWVEVNPEEAKVTINFLIPMKEEAFSQHIRIENTTNLQEHFDCQVNWINNQVVEIKLQEKDMPKGQKVKLSIHKAPSRMREITKSESIWVQFKTDIYVQAPENNRLISSTHAFKVCFNTPISLNELKRHVKSETQFDIETINKDEKQQDETQFLFTPREPLENGRTYVLSIQAGMCSRCGTHLKKDHNISLQVDQKPSITRAYPNDGDKWIGLYPRMLIESKEAIVAAMADLDGKKLKGTLIDKNHACFFSDQLLAPQTAYTLQVQVQVESGEVSSVKKIHFSTTTLDEQRFWMDIRKDAHLIECYQGKTKIKSIPCQLSTEIDTIPLGTYYLEGKAEVYEDAVHHVGGNYWMIVSEQFGIQGTLRNAYWEPIQNFSQGHNIIVNDEEAAWLYQKITTDTMIILRY